MIYRLDKPTSQATFTVGSDGIPPTSSKYATPTTQIRYTDTVYTTPQSGLTAYWYSNTSVGYDIPVGTAYASNQPLMKFWWGSGLPPYFTIQEVSKNWSVKLKGYVRWPYTGNVNFYVGGEGIISKFTVAFSDLRPDNSDMTLSLSDTTHLALDPFTSVTEGDWEPIEIHYEQRKPFSQSNAGFCVLWDTDSIIATPDKVVLSSGIIHVFTEGVPVDGEDAVGDTALASYSNVDLSVSEGQGSTFTFDVPFLSTNLPISTAMPGYYYDPGSDLYRDIHHGRILKKFRKITYWQGYMNPSNEEELVQKFAGQIRDFNIKHSRSGDTLEVVCHDFSILTKEQLNTDAPNPIDYVASGYMDHIRGHVDGRSKPPTFDGWEVHKAFAIMCMNSFLDPYYMMLRERRSTLADKLSYSNYFVSPYGLPYKIYLDRAAINYGNPSGLEPDDQVKGATRAADDAYLAEIGFGEFYQDSINKIAQIYGMEWGVNRYGYAYLKVLDIPRAFFNDRQGVLNVGGGGPPS